MHLTNYVTLMTDMWLPDRTSSPLARLGFACIRIDEKELKDDLPGLSRAVLIGWPHWFLFVAAAILPTVELWRRLRRRHLQPGLCKKCGYDLRGTPRRCPECGAVPAEAKA